MNTIRRLALVAATAAALGAAYPVLAQQPAWPAKPVRLILSQPGGASPDIVARLLAERLSKAWGQNIVVDNRPGGANVVGSVAAAKSAPDGYTFFYATTAALVSNLYTLRNLPYDPVKDFIPVGMIGVSPFVIVAANEVPARTLPELIALARSQPGKLSFASDGIRGLAGLLGEYTARLADVKIVQVPYQNNNVALQDMIAGRTQVSVQALALATRFIKAGQMRALAVSSAQRVPGFENIPPIGDTLPGFDLVGWHAIVAPTGTPSEIVRRVNQDLDRVLKDPEIAAKLADLGPMTEGAGTPESTARFFAAERERWARLAKDTGLVPE